MNTYVKNNKIIIISSGFFSKCLFLKVILVVYNQSDIKNIINIIINIIPNTEKIILFGSYANGKAHTESDLDFAILTDIIFQRQEKLDLLTKLRWSIAKMGYDADIIIKNLEDYLNESKYPTLSNVISNEGVQVWSRN